MADEPNTSNPYALVLEDLEARRAQLDQAIEVIRKAMGLNANVSLVDRPGGDGVVKAGAFHGMTIPEAAKQLLALRKAPLGNQEITDQLIAGGVVFKTATPVNTVASVLHRASSKSGGEIVKVGRGKWGLALWYPNAGRFQKKKGDDKDGEAVAAQPAPAATPGPWPKAAT